MLVKLVISNTDDQQSQQTGLGSSGVFLDVDSSGLFLDVDSNGSFFVMIK